MKNLDWISIKDMQMNYKLMLQIEGVDHIRLQRIGNLARITPLLDDSQMILDVHFIERVPKNLKSIMAGKKVQVTVGAWKCMEVLGINVTVLD
jgi:hypothetical protein